MQGVFIVFEGGDGVGKSTQIQMLAKALKRKGYKILLTREPGGTSIGEKLRLILKREPMCPLAELLIFEASRAELVETRILPHLRKGGIVLSDRFQDSSVVYQGIVRGIGVDRVKLANQLATSNLTPHRSILLDPKDKRFSARLRSRRKTKDRFEREQNAFHSRVEAAFRKIAKKNPRYRIYQAERPRQEIHNLILRDLEKLIRARR